MQIHKRTPRKEYHMTLVEFICSKFLLCEEKGWEAATCTRLLTAKQIDKEEPQHIAPHPVSNQLTSGMHIVHKI
jgi:hypothetical protein